MLTTKQGIVSRGQIFEGPVVTGAIPDRLLHRSTVLSTEGESYRSRADRERVQQLRQDLRVPRPTGYDGISGASI